MTRQQAEHEDFERGGFDPFEGFCRGDLDRDYEADRNDMNEAEMQDDIRAGNGHLWGVL